MAKDNRTFVESNVDDNAPNNARSAPASSPYTVETRPTGSQVGIRAAPGDQGFLYADTPEATVYLGKKQWLQEEWTYITDPTEKQGRLFETWKRDILERIITRKLEWLSDHEQYSKIKAAVASFSEFGKNAEQLKASLTRKGADPNQVNGADLQQLLDLEFAPVGFTGNTSTRYYTAALSGVSGGAIGNYARSLAKLRSVESLAGPDDAGSLALLVADQKRQIASLTQSITSLTQEVAALDEQIRIIVQNSSNGVKQVTDQHGTTVEISVLLGIKVKERAAVQEQLNRMQVSLSAANELLVEYQAKQQNPSLDALRQQVAQDKIKAEQELKENPRLVPLDAFNGIIEFANVTSINTTITNHGQGSASFGMENPRNMLTISKEDILLALSEDPNLVDGGLSKTVPALTTDASTSRGNLTYYRGRYYNPAGLRVALENSAAFDASSGFVVDQDSVTLNRYRKQQQSVYDDINFRLNRYPAEIKNDFKQVLSLNDYTVVSSAWINQYKKPLGLIYQGSVTTAGSPNPSVISALNGIQQTLSNLEKQIRDLSDPNAKKDPNGLGASDVKNSSPISPSGVASQQANTIFPALQKVASSVPGVDPVELSKQFYRDLVIHFQGKLIIEVGDTVWLWMSSPSRTVQISETGIPIAESTSGASAVSINNYAKIKQLTQKRDQAKDNLRILQETRDPKYQRAIAGTASEKDLEDIETLNDDIRAREDEVDETQQQIDDILGGQSQQETVAKAETSQNIGTASNSPTAGQVLNSSYAGFQEIQFQVFEGVITSSTSTFNGTDYTVNVQCKDLTYYLEMSRIIEKPTLNSQRDTIAVLNDPIYRVAKTDIERQRLLKDFGGYVREDDPRAGRWKSGMFVTTHEIYDTVSKGIVDSNNTSVSDAKSAKELTGAHGLSVYQHLFTGLDSANLVSVLVTGMPFNFSLYAANLVQVGATSNFIVNADGSLEASPNSIFELTRATVNDQNSRLGNFKPFMELTQNYTDEELKNLQQLTEDRLKIFTTMFDGRGTPPDVEKPNDPKIRDAFVQAAQAAALAERNLPAQYLEQFKGKYQPKQLQLTTTELQALSVYADGLRIQQLYALQLEQFKALLKTSPTTQGSPEEQAKGLRSQNAAVISATRSGVVQRKKSNFLLVSDQYASNLNIQPYIKRVSNSNMSELWRSSYQSIYKLCKEAAEIVDFEFYCDENGHLRFKQPTYNRTLQEHFDVDSYPEEMRTEFLKKFPTVESTAVFAAGSTLVNQLTLGISSLRDVVTGLVTSPGSDQKVRSIDKLESLKRLNGASSKKDIETANSDLKAVFDDYLQQDAQLQATTTQIAPGYDPTDLPEPFASQAVAGQGSRRALAESLLVELEKIQLQYLETSGPKNLNFLGSLQDKALNDIKTLPYFLDNNHVHRINPNIVLTETFTEQPPDFNRVDVTGMQDFVATENLTNGLFIWAGGVDYDLWHSYGFRESGSVQKPFIHTREVAREYCQALLSRQRARTLSAALTVRGDSKYRVGDCVFIEDRYMYFYITGVSHSFSYGNDYATTLTLEYSRRPGEFIAHPFDVVGRAQADSDAAVINKTYQLKKTE